MKEAWQINSEFGGYAEPLPPLEPATFGDDMANETKRTATVIMVTVMVTRPDGTVKRHVASEKLPTEDYPIHKAVAHLAARLEEQFPERVKRRAD